MWRRATAPRQRLVSCAFLMDMAAGAVALAVQFTGVALGAGPDMLGLLGALSAGAYAIFCLVNGWLVDQFGPRHTTRVAMLLLIVVWAAMARAGQLGQLLGLVVVSGALLSLFWPSTMVWLASLTAGHARGLGRALGLFNISWSAGLLVGSVVAGVLWDWAAASSFYYAVGAAVVILALLQLTPGGRQARRQPPQPVAPVSDGQRRALGRRLLIAGRIATFASFFSASIIRSFFPKVGDVLGYSSALVGWAIGARYFSSVVIFAAARATTCWHYRTWKLWLAAATGIAGMALVTVARTPGQFVVGFFLVGVCVGISYLTSQFYGLHGPAERRGTSMGHHEAVLGAGVVLGPLLGGLLAKHTGYLYITFALGAAVMLLAGFAQLVVWWAMARRA